MSYFEVVKRYSDLVITDLFINYEKEFSDRIISALSKAYVEELYEPEQVYIIKEVVNSVNNLTKKNFELNTNSIYIHGKKSNVEFNYYGKQITKELADLIFIVTICYRNKKYFEKITFNQFKNENHNKSKISWSIRDKEQLYLLSRFPRFKGVSGLIPKKDYNLPDYTGCLGSYGLLYRPGDFVFISATRLDACIDLKTSLSKVELNKLNDELYIQFYPYPLIPNLFRNCHFAQNIYRFIHEFLRMNIGEPTFMMEGICNEQVRTFIVELMNVLRIKAVKERNDEVKNFVDDFNEFPYAEVTNNRFDETPEFDIDSDGLAIIHTTIHFRE